MKDKDKDIITEKMNDKNGVDPSDEMVDDNNINDTEPEGSVDEVADNAEGDVVDSAVESDEAKDGDEPSDEEKGRPATYMPRFTEASEQYRRKGDAKIRKRLGIKDSSVQEPSGNPDEIKLDPTAEFDADFMGTEDAKAPVNSAVDESDESISVMKFASDDDVLEAEAERERAEIKKLLGNDSAPAKDEEPEEEIEEPVAEEKEEYSLPDPDADEIKVFEFVDHEMDDEAEAESSSESAEESKKSKKTAVDSEFSNPTQRDGIKDRFLDLILSIKIRLGASVIFALAILVLELLSASKIIGFGVFEGSVKYSTLGILDFLLASCMFILAIPEIFGAVKDLFNNKASAALLPIPMFASLGFYTLAVSRNNLEKYALLGFVFATAVVPVLAASLHRAKADFIAFKMISQPDSKEVIDLQNTRDLDVENNALDGVVDEYKSRLSRTFTTAFVSDFFKNSESAAMPAKHFGLIYGIPFGVALVVGIVYFFLAKSLVGAMAVFSLVSMLGCPVFSVMAGKISFFHAQRAALNTDSTAIGENAYHSFAGVDVFAFDDTDLFGPEDVNLKRFMLYGDRDNVDKVMRQMCALFAAVGGPLDYMFSGIIDNRMRHKTASNVIIEDDGICGEVAGRKICAGSEDYMRRNGIAIPAAAMGRDTRSSDNIKIMYAAEDGEVNAKFYIRYSFSEEFTSIIPSLRESGIIPLVYTRDPNVSNELLSTLNANSAVMRVVKLYDPTNEVSVKAKTSARMITYGDRLDAAEMVVLAKKYHRFSNHMRFAEICAMIIGVVLAITLVIITRNNFKAIPMAALWNIVMCGAIRAVSKMVFLKDSKKKSMD